MCRGFWAIHWSINKQVNLIHNCYCLAFPGNIYCCIEFSSFFGYADAYAQSAVFYAHICGYMRTIFGLYLDYIRMCNRFWTHIICDRLKFLIFVFFRWLLATGKTDQCRDALKTICDFNKKGIANFFPYISFVAISSLELGSPMYILYPLIDI